MKQRIIAVVGPTASGKTHRGVELALAFNGEIVSADSRQVYTGMDVGTGKDIDEYPPGLGVHMLDIAPAGYRYNLYEYLRDARKAVEGIEARGARPVIVGGTGLYVETLLKGTVLPEVPANPALRASLEGRSLDELKAMLAELKTLHNNTDTDTAQRAIRALEIEHYYLEHPQEAAMARNPEPLDALVVGVDIPRDTRRRRIESRLKTRLYDQGMLDEVKRLLDSGIAPDDLIYYGLEYKFVTQYLTGCSTKEEMETGLLTAIHQFAKRQMTWFRGMERRGFEINWLPFDMSDNEFVDAVGAMLVPEQ